MLTTFLNKRAVLSLEFSMIPAVIFPSTLKQTHIFALLGNQLPQGSQPGPTKSVCFVLLIAAKSRTASTLGRLGAELCPLFATL